VLALVPEAIDAYAAAHTVPAPELLQELAAETRAKTSAPQMMVGDIEGRFLQLLVQLGGCKRVVEVGTFTGYSALMMAEGLPDGGELVTCELLEAHAEIARRYFAKSPHGKKIKLRLGPAIDTLRSLPAAETDLIFLDADKTGYPDYYEEGLRLLRPGGLLVADNVLWSGKVLDPKDDDTRALVAVADRARKDPRVTPVMLTVRDGLLLARKK
jgi:caffeoyl-CoA O-methyltransferase